MKRSFLPVFVVLSTGSLLIGSDATPTSLTPSMVTVEGGTLPLYTDLWPASVANFEIGKYEVTWSQWQQVRAWAVDNGYSDLASVGEGSDSQHPVRNVNWYDVLKWCNALSEMMGLIPVYQVGGSTYKTGQNIPTVNATANGYRLPTDVEWEHAARGGRKASQPFTYSGSNNLLLVGWFRTNSGGAAQDLNSGRGTWPVGAKLPNDLGLHDMSGNVWEWCQEFAGSSTARIRGGSWDNTDFLCAVGSRNVEIAAVRRNTSGFRLARSSTTSPPLPPPPPPASPAVQIELVTVRDEGNAANTVPDGLDAIKNVGSVDYVYQIGKFEVTTSQYVAFLNSVAATNTNSYITMLWHPLMASSGVNGVRIYNNRIFRQGAGTPADPYTYSFEGSGNTPANWMSWMGAARFCNWLHNSAHDGSDTEQGAYTLNGTTNAFVERNANARWWIPNIDEWYKAAYYKGGSRDAGYWLYATESDVQPEAESQPPGSSNSANYNFARANNQIGSFPEVGAYSNSPSYYGTFDQAGNVSEIVEESYFMISDGRTYSQQAGGSYVSGPLLLRSSIIRTGFSFPWSVGSTSGMRVAAAYDSDGDGLNDRVERLLEPLGFDPYVAQPDLVEILLNAVAEAGYVHIADVVKRPESFGLVSAAELEAAEARLEERFLQGVAHVTSSPSMYNLYTSGSIMDLRMGGLMLQKQSNHATVIFQPQTTTDLTQPFTNNGPPVTNAIPMPGNKGFLRIQAKPE